MSVDVCKGVYGCVDVFVDVFLDVCMNGLLWMCDGECGWLRVCVNMGVNVFVNVGVNVCECTFV